MDFFKSLNDSAGHLRGDECLRRLSRICERFAVVEHDLVARYGGEEFVLLLPGRTLEAAVEQGEALRRAVRRRSAGPSGISPGAACNHQRWRGGTGAPAQASPEQLVAAADRAMYDAKNGGRNRVAWHTPV